MRNDLLRPTEFSDPSGLRRVLQNCEDGDKVAAKAIDLYQREYWPRNQNPFTGTVSVTGDQVDRISHQSWDFMFRLWSNT